MDELDDILKSLGLPPMSRKIYRELLRNGETTARVLSERLLFTRPSTYDHLSLLKKKGLIVEKQIGHKSFFAVADTRGVGELLNSTIEDLEEKKRTFETLLPALGTHTVTSSPTIKFFEGKLGLTHLLNDILWHNAKQISTMWPYNEMVRVVGKEALVRFNRRRLDEGIRVRALWPYGMKEGTGYIWRGVDQHVERRRAKKGVSWQMACTIYGSRVSFISSHREVFGFIVSSKDFADLMQVQFDALWKESRRLAT